MTKRPSTTISDYLIISDNQVIKKTQAGVEVLKLVKKDDKGFYVRGRFYDGEPSKIYLEDFENRLKVKKSNLQWGE